jgi:putative serine protease PepD
MTDLRIRWTGGELTASPGTTVRIGRDPAAEIHTDNPNVSRQHAEAVYSGGRWMLRDVGSAQGTWRNGQRVDSVEVRGTVQVTLGTEGRGEVVTLEAAASPGGVAPTELPGYGGGVQPTVVVGDAQAPLPRAGLGPSDTVVVGAGASAAGGGGANRPGGALRADAFAGATVVTGDTLNLECAGRSYSFAPGRDVTIGRDDSCEVVSTNPTVSRMHARLTHDGSGWTLRDLGSSGGTFVDGRKVSDHKISGSVAAWLGDTSTGERVVMVASGPTAKSRSKSNRTAILVVAACVAAVAVVGALFVLLSGGDSVPSNDALGRATVRLIAGDVVGSGTIIDADEGLILTNAHVVDGDAPGTAVRDVLFDFELESSPREIEVLVAPALGKTAEPRFIAEVETVDGYLDLAVLRITKTIGGQLIEPDGGDLDDLVAVDIGDSDGVNAGDEIKVFGYPAAAQTASVTLTDGSVSGLVQDDRLGSNRAMMNITAAVSPGNSGGLAVNSDGKLIGVPSIIRDDTVPSMRPSAYAEDLIDAARSGEEYTSPWFRPLAGEQISDPRWVAPGAQSGIDFDCDGGPLEVADGSAIGLAFDYEAFAAGEHQDILVVVMSGDTTIGVRTLNIDYPVDWASEDGCATITVPIDLDAPIETEALTFLMGIGPDYDTDW